MNLRSVFARWRRDYDFKTFLSAAAALLSTAVFALYNGFLGILHSSAWHGSICVYYLLLVLLRGAILRAEKRASESDLSLARQKRRQSSRRCSLILLLLNLGLIAPIALLVKLQRPVGVGLIPAIAMAAYSFYKITLAAINLFKQKRSANSLVRLLRSINFIDALLSIMTLLITLIMVATVEDKASLLPLTAITSAGMWLMMAMISVSCVLRGAGEDKPSAGTGGA